MAELCSVLDCKIDCVVARPESSFKLHCMNEHSKHREHVDSYFQIDTDDEKYLWKGGDTMYEKWGNFVKIYIHHCSTD